MSDPDRRDDASLVARCLAGDVSAFEELYRQHAGRLYSLALRMLGNAADAEDLLQEVFLTAYRKLAGFKGASTLGTWLYRLTVNACLDHLRSRSARNDLRTDSLDRADRPPVAIVHPAAGSGRPESLDYSRFDLERAIRQVPQAARTCFVLHDIEGFEHHEIATMLGIAVGTSKSQVHKARMKIREHLRSGETS
ncbi:MAG: sigma-70 family RNA polymerase sigma factor [Luteitalea sp.]|nr:sigma-70 family RNA polymerase sigma factor [Luteitalea sp.]